MSITGQFAKLFKPCQQIVSTKYGMSAKSSSLISKLTQSVQIRTIRYVYSLDSQRSSLKRAQKIFVRLFQIDCLCQMRIINKLGICQGYNLILAI